jgi:hypothetical protein
MDIVLVAELSCGLVSRLLGVGIAEAMSVTTVPPAPVALRMTVKIAVFPGAMLETLQVIVVPVLPTAGVEQLQPAGSAPIDEKVELAGIVSVNTTFGAALGPLLTTVWV